jgi:hypothetical protein
MDTSKSRNLSWLCNFQNEPCLAVIAFFNAVKEKPIGEIIHIGSKIHGCHRIKSGAVRLRNENSTF